MDAVCITVGSRFGDPPAGEEMGWDGVRGRTARSATAMGPQKPNADNADGHIARCIFLFLVRPVDDGIFDDQSNNRDSVSLCSRRLWLDRSRHVPGPPCRRPPFARAIATPG